MLVHSSAEVAAARLAIQSRAGLVPTVGLILGSGLGELADSVADASVIQYHDIPHFPKSTVHGHRSELVVGTLGSTPVAVMRGRFHFYEGYTPAQTTFPVRVMQALGVKTLIVTNAAGGLRADWQVGDLMVINDHINMLGMTGHNPLRGANDDQLGTRFPAMTYAYTPELIALAHKTAKELGFALREGVYAQVAGPSFETRAELKMLQMLGADAVGMSTASEVIVAAHAGLQVLGVSMISNIATPDAPPANHEEVLAAGEAVKEHFGRLVARILEKLA